MSDNEMRDNPENNARSADSMSKKSEYGCLTHIIAFFIVLAALFVLWRYGLHM